MKKILTFTLVLCLLLSISTFVFAEMNESLNDAGQAIGNVVDDAGQAIRDGAEDAGEAIRDGAEDVTGAVRSGVQGAENAVEDAGNKVVSGTQNAFGDNNEDNGYTATRTATEGMADNMNSTMWIWITMAIAAIAIVALVWYYGMQNDVTRNHDEQ